MIPNPATLVPKTDYNKVRPYLQCRCGGDRNVFCHIPVDLLHNYDMALVAQAVIIASYDNRILLKQP